MRAFSRLTVAVVALVAMMAQPGWSQRPPTLSPDTLATIKVYAAKAVKLASSPTRTPQDSMAAIGWMTEAVKMANPQFSEPYTNIPNGEFVWVPKAGIGLVPYVTQTWHTQSEKGCMWQISAYDLFGQRPVVVPDTTVKVVVPVSAPAFSWAKFFDENSWFLLLVLLFAVLVWAVWYLLRERRRERLARELLAQQNRETEERQRLRLAEQERLAEEERQLNPDIHPPVIPGGISENSEVALRQIQAVTQVRHGSNRQVTGHVRGIVRSINGQEAFLTMMDFADGPRRSRMRNGEEVSRIEVLENEETHVEFWRRHCGNRFAEIGSGRFELPEGWEFVPLVPTASTPDTETAADAAVTSIEQAAARIHANAEAQLALNPTGEFTITVTTQNGTPESERTLTIKSTGHRPIRVAKFNKEGGLAEVNS